MSTKGKVTVIGLGAMGVTLAKLLLRAGYAVTVWNRSADKAKELVEAGVVLAQSPAAAVASSPVTVVIVYDHKATKAILETPEVEAVLEGRTLLQLTTVSPAEARSSLEWATSNGAGYVNGAIQAAPGQMGRPDTPILVSGNKDLLQQLEGILQTFGGGVTNLGENIAAAPTVDLATLSYIYGSSIGFFHGARVMEAEGLPVNEFGNIVAGITPTFGEFLQYQGNKIHGNDYTIGESPLRISVEATARIQQAAEEAGINTEFPVLAASLLKRADAAGYGNEEVAAVIKVLRAG
ncbi:NAD(P)-dependent oxidoreductase [Chitinophaga sp. GCM10012297]|uniref:NAD(P)-dependent oxidoreductase n=1 Tax=Chitinophaga chungangae TaxID=2821488 RepID=A0ABS3YAU5_9BACT|nr:NAD(P)-binding domain-containing protein [Chitinophaga chungangae]MBO9151798.1 NAD(P)-dependent oxidoreductase [Chitinophaga chungangae]